MAIAETEASTDRSIVELVSIRRQIKFTNVMLCMAVGLLALVVSRETIGVATYGVLIAMGICLAMR